MNRDRLENVKRLLDELFGDPRADEVLIKFHQGGIRSVVTTRNEAV